jgi:hypothetical protein
LAASHSKGVVRLQDVATGKELRQLKELTMLMPGLDLSLYGETPAAARPEGLVVFWDSCRAASFRVLPCRSTRTIASRYLSGNRLSSRSKNDWTPLQDSSGTWDSLIMAVA